MQKAPLHPREDERLEVLRAKKLVGTGPDPRFDAITQEAVQKLSVPISTITLIDKDKEIYKSCVGIEEKEGPRDVSFCGHALLEETLLVVSDTLKDERFKDNPYVTGDPYVRFYAGMRLCDEKSGLPLGVFCIKDTKPRELSTGELGTFLTLAERAEKLVQ